MDNFFKRFFRPSAERPAADVSAPVEGVSYYNLGCTSVRCQV